MKKLLLLLLFFPLFVSAQVTSKTAYAIRSVTSLPTTCNYNAQGRVDEVFLTTGSAGFYLCASNGTSWTGPYPTSGGGGSGTVTTSGSPGSPQLARFSSSTAITTATATEVSTPLLCTDAGNNDTYTCTASPAISAYATGQFFIFAPNTSNTGAATLNVNGKGAKAIQKVVGSSVTDPADNDLRKGGVYFVVYDGSEFIITSLLGNAALPVTTTRVSTQFLKTNNTLTNITGLSVSVVSGKTYQFVARLYTTTGVVGGGQVAISGTCTATAFVGNTNAFSPGTLTTADLFATLDTAVDLNDAGDDVFVEITGTITVDTSGTLTVQFAQSNTDTAASSVNVGSTFQVQEIP